MFTKSLISAGLAGLALCTQPAAARSVQPVQFDAQGAQPAQRLVQCADLDLSTPKGQSHLEARLRSAANAVCEANYGLHPLSEALEARRCYRNALQSAHRQVASISTVKLVSR